MFPQKLFDDDDEKKESTPPLLMLTEMDRTNRDWIVIYHFFLGPLDGHFAMYLGSLTDMDEAAARAAAFAPNSPQLDQARLALLRGITLETMN